MDELDVKGSGQQNRKTTPANKQHNPQCANYWAPLTRQRHHEEHWLQWPSQSIDPTQHAKGRTGDCPGRETDLFSKTLGEGQRHGTRPLGSGPSGA